MDDQNAASARPRYVWPWFVLAALLLGIALAVVWMGAEVRRTRERREMSLQPVEQRTNAPVGSKAGATNALSPRP